MSRFASPASANSIPTFGSSRSRTVQAVPSSISQRPQAPRLKHEVRAEALGRDRRREGDRDAAFELAHHLRVAFSDSELGAELDRLGAIERGTGDRAIDNGRWNAPPILEGEDGLAMVELQALMAPVLWNAEGLAVDEPGDLPCELLLLARWRIDRHREAVLDFAQHSPLDPPDIVEIDDHPAADLARCGRQEIDAVRGDVERLARKFASILQHVAAMHGEAHAPISPALL